MQTIFLHGLGQTADSWDNVLARLDASVSLVCPSLFPLLAGKKASYQNLYAAVSQLCDAREGKISLCGLSLGAVLALQYAIEHPQKVEKLVLIAGQCKSPRVMLAIQNLLFHLMPEKNFQGIGLSKRDFMSFMKSMAPLDMTAQIGTLSMPVLLLHGDADKANAKAAQTMAKLIPKSQLMTIPNAGHEVNRDNPGGLAEVLNAFLTA